MANKSIQHSYGGMMQDVTSSKFSNGFYFEGKNIKIIATDLQSTGSVTNEKGNKLMFSIPTLRIDLVSKTIFYGSKTLLYKTSEITSSQSLNQIIIGNTTCRDGAILFTTDNSGVDCVWKFNFLDNDLTLLYLRNMGFSNLNPIQAINNFENSNIDKVYWIDGIYQLRFINIEHSIANKDLEELIDIPLNVINMVGKSALTQPIVTSVSSGGIHTSGMIQYVYNLYRLNSSQTKISPFSQMISLDKGALGGGELNEVIGSSPIVSITDIDGSYTNIKVYAIKYTSYNESPSVSLIDDRSVPSSRSIEIFDDGNIISTLSLEEFLFLGSDIIIAKHINTKFNRLFLANYNEVNFNIDIDTRAYSFGNTTSNFAPVFHNLSLSPQGVPAGDPSKTVIIRNDSDYDNPLLIKHDSVNLYYDLYKYQKNNITYGGEGKYLKYELTKSTIFNEDSRYFKDEEIYRLGIQFFNGYNQVSLPNWIADFKALDGNLSGQYNTLSVTLKSEFFTWLNTNNFETEYDKPVGYKIIIAERTLKDRTIVANGLMSTMMINDRTATPNQGVISKVNSLPKLPNILNRSYNRNTLYGISKPLTKALHLSGMSIRRLSVDNEMPRADREDKDTAGRFYQFNSMMQLYSPEILFNNSIQLSEGLKLRVKGALKNNTNNAWGRIYETGADDVINNEIRVTGSLTATFLQPQSTFEIISGGLTSPWNQGLVSGVFTNDYSKAGFVMYDRIYGGNNPTFINTGLYVKSPLATIYNIYGKPEIVEKGQNGKNYNNDPNYRYVNSLEGILTDSGKSNYDDAKNSTFKGKLISINSHGQKSMVLVLGGNEPGLTHSTRPNYEGIGAAAGITGDNNGLIGELIKTDVDIYLGNIYGGNSYEDKKRTNYIEIGTYAKFNNLFPTIYIDSPGDTYVNFFKYARIVKTDKKIISEGTFVLEELITVLCETTIDLKNRNDISLQSWDSRFQPSNDEYHKYNRVYSQLPTLIRRRDIDYNAKLFNRFDTNVITTRIKSAGEIIDNWTDIQSNEVLSLDGKHGPINSLVSFNDELYTLQDKAFAFLSINPRVQVQGQDGLAIQLGSGSVLDRYKYISTDSGTLNKWSVITSPQSIYYYDTLNSSIMSFKGGLENLNITKGMHAFFVNNTSLEALKINNPLILKGVSSGYDYNNQDVFMTFNQIGKPSFTLSYNEIRGQFISYHDYKPSMYISQGDYTFTTDPLNKSIYRQNIGLYNEFYGVKYPSTITLNVNPEPNSECIFDNISYNSEVYINGVDQPLSTLDHITAYNDYQNSGRIPLTIGRNNNIRRKFRTWNALIPREGRNRIRSPWMKLKLEYLPNNNQKIVLSDIEVYYTS